jgi:nucleoid-associated protein YgaU
LRLYLNGTVLAEVIAGTDGHWSVKVGKGLVPGHYAVRADQIDGSNGSVAARAEVPFDYTQAPALKEAMAAAEPAPSARGALPKPELPAKPERRAKSSGEISVLDPMTRRETADKAVAVVPEIQTATVDKGTSLWRISRHTLGRGTRYTEIYAANSDQIRDPKLIYPGQIFVIPSQSN